MNFILHDADLSGGDEISWNCVKSFGKSLKVADYVSCSVLHDQHSAVSCQALFLVSFVTLFVHWYSKQ